MSHDDRLKIALDECSAHGLDVSKVRETIQVAQRVLKTPLGEKDHTSKLEALSNLRGVNKWVWNRKASIEAQDRALSDLGDSVAHMIDRYENR